ncbi:MAG TPA: DUF3488 and transglutaminase-like domain-containing protein [Humisphaera sp.]|jgi:transglutaminase-like putative cysteine protease|nr:DUF3488 and transglutaminase-like domain-containing protein [Humisphaera sp.]
MHDLRQFKPALYLLLLLGVSGYCIAAETPGVWVGGCFFILLHAWLSFRGRFKPMTRALTNFVTLTLLAYVLYDAMVAVTTPVLVVGEFLVFLQLIKLWELRSNRDYAQLLVLGLLLTVAAAISTASLGFGIVWIIYLLLSLYCCLLFHLKTESDAAIEALGDSQPKFDPATLEQDRRMLARSVWRLSAAGSLVGLALGVLVFLIFPRGNGSGFLGNFQMPVNQTLVGFSDKVSFQNIARLQQSSDTVAWVSLTHNGQPVEQAQTLLLRGSTLDTYHGNSTPDKGSRYQWARTDLDEGLPRIWPPIAGDEHSFAARPHELRWLDMAPRRPATRPSLLQPQPPPPTLPADTWEQHFTLKPTGTPVLFSMAGPLTIKAFNRQVRIRYLRSSQIIQTFDPIREPVEYEVIATNQVAGPNLRPPTLAQQTNRISLIDPQIIAMAKRPQVSGSNQRGSLASQRDPLHAASAGAATAGAAAGAGTAGAATIAPDELDEQIATNIEQYLKTNYAYTLDLTDTRLVEGRDPLVAFLYDFKKGHCEYFAGAMTLMCQSLGLQARMVVGFHCDADSLVGGYYLVRQSNAHAWVEVLTTNGWKTFDPTSAIGAPPRKLSLWENVRNLINYLDFAYAKSVIAYDGEHQTNLRQRGSDWVTNAVIRIAAFIDAIRRAHFGRGDPRLAEEAGLADRFWTIAIRSFVALMALCLTIAVGGYLWSRYQLRRRAARIGIASLPLDEQLRLARQLGFYDDLLRLLARHQIDFAREQTPREFSRSLLYLPASAYSTVLRLTELFYRVRYGKSELTPGRHRHLASALARLAEELGPAPSTG